jgi:hypothetical protein
MSEWRQLCDGEVIGGGAPGCEWAEIRGPMPDVHDWTERAERKGDVVIVTMFDHEDGHAVVSPWGGEALRYTRSFPAAEIEVRGVL